MINSTQTEPHIEAFGIEWREFALNGEKGRRMGRDFNAVFERFCPAGQLHLFNDTFS
jgi:hypothetical protein